MSALAFKLAGGYGQCSTPSCQRAGRYSLIIAGYPVYSDSPYASREARELFCRPCRTQMVQAWSGAAQSLPEKAVAQAVGQARNGRVAERVEAIDSLREWGFTAEGVRSLKAAA